MRHENRIIRADRLHMRSHHRNGISGYFREVVYGAIDGIITTFAVVAGFSGATLSSDTTMQLSFGVVLLFGIANLFADGISMGLGGFLAVRSEQAVYKKIRNREECTTTRYEDIEEKETVRVLMERGFSEQDAKELMDIFRRNDGYWVDFIIDNELDIPNPMHERPAITGMITFASFVFFGAIPLLPFMIMQDAGHGTTFFISAVGAGIAFVVLGLLKWRMSGVSVFAAVFEVVLVGSVAATVAFFVGTLLSV
ncbi:MAG TPA: VIT1/CCC1 transporter family protein [Candidatus Paceibacterota bacterium]|nr:VIT1/CCC1 transporter family protein [Candidatus Paceibacterota bacterium]